MAVGKNGQRSDAGTVAFDWGMTVRYQSTKSFSAKRGYRSQSDRSELPDADGVKALKVC